MRTYGRPINQDGSLGPWTEVTTDANGFNDMVMLTTLCQVVKLNINESPFFADWGLPAHQSIMQQVSPDIFMVITQQRFAPYFSVITLAKRDVLFPGKGNVPTPVYDINVLTHQGVKLNPQIPVPQ